MYLTADHIGGTDWYPGHSAVLEDNPGTHGVISGLRGSMTYRLAVQVYQRHYDPGDGRCVRCGQLASCPPHDHAAAVIRAAGDDPRRHDPQPLNRPHHYAGFAPANRWDHPRLAG